jgi:hypothetical protein
MGGLLSTLFDSTYVRYILLNNLYLPLKISLSRGLGSFTGLILPHFCAVPSQDLYFQHHMSYSFIVFIDLRLEVVFHFVYIDEIVDQNLIYSNHATISTFI